MRPLRLRLQGFTAFREPQELDFSDLDLFALWGPTGAGKSSLLDAITYALYGSVERVGREVGELISQGQPRLSVSLDFRVDGRDYRVTRSRQRNGQTHVLLERLEGREWVSFGEGADRVRTVNELIETLVGLDYVAFTRSVLLPQGKFAEFLLGDASKRREILTELLGLELFQQMARRANEIAGHEQAQAASKEEFVAGHLAHASAPALEEAEQRAARLQARARELGKLAEQLEARARRVDELLRAAEQTLACARELTGLAVTFEGHAQALREAAEERGACETALARARKELERAGQAAAEAEAEAAEARARLGTPEHLGRLAARAEALPALRSAAERAADASDEARAEVARLEEELATAQATLEDAEAAERAAAEAERRAEARLEEARRANLVAALSAGLGPGDPCPVCGRELEVAAHADHGALDEALAAHETARAAHDKARAAARKARDALSGLAGSLDGARKVVEDRARAAREATRKAEEAASDLAEALGGELPDDPAAEVGARLETVRKLEAEAEVARNRVSAARDALAEAERALAGLDLRVERVRSSVQGARADNALRRAGRQPLLEEVDLGGDAGALARTVARLSEQLRACAGELEAEAGQARRSAAEITQSALAQMPEEIAATDDFGRALTDLRAVAGSAQESAGEARNEVRTLTRDLERRRRLEEEVAAHRRAHATYADLARLLRSNAIVDYIQGEALALLCEAASAHLGSLSRGRYRLRYGDDTFFVVDAWNGEETRNVRTLSGGETFLTSLSLALALSEQIQQLAVTEKRRLESLFLDEGFGTLDAESLEEVVEALGRLQQDDRLVGVITHVPELAERMPVRIEVVKSPRGSRLERRTGELASLP